MKKLTSLVLIITILSLFALIAAAEERTTVRLGLTDESAEILWNPVKEEVAWSLATTRFPIPRWPTARSS